MTSLHPPSFHRNDFSTCIYTPITGDLTCVICLWLCEENSGQLPLHLWWKERLLKYLDKLCSEDIPLLLKDAVNLSMHDLSSGSNTNWAGKIRSLNQTGFSSCFSPSHGCDSTLRNQIMCTLRDQFIQKWAEDLLREQSVGAREETATTNY